MNVRERVHVAPLGFEHDRVLLPAQNLKADKLYLLEHDQPDAIETWYHGELRERIEKSDIDLRREDCNIFGLYDTLGTVAEIISEHGKDEVYVNVSSGSKISAIGGMIACMATGATPYYVHPKSYGREDLEKPEPVSEGMDDISELPAYPVDAPSEEKIAVLNYIDSQEYATKEDLIEFSEAQSLEYISESEAKSKKAKYRLLETNIISPLSEDGYIQIRQVGRTKRVSLTPAGENALRAFGYLNE
jgi:hypothetical protein